MAERLCGTGEAAATLSVRSCAQSANGGSAKPGRPDQEFKRGSSNRSQSARVLTGEIPVCQFWEGQYPWMASRQPRGNHLGGSPILSQPHILHVPHKRQFTRSLCPGQDTFFERGSQVPGVRSVQGSIQGMDKEVSESKDKADVACDVWTTEGMLWLKYPPTKNEVVSFPFPFEPT